MSKKLKYLGRDDFKIIENGIERDPDDERELDHAIEKIKASFNYESPISLMDALKEGIEYEK